MDDHRFDTLARSLSSRRLALGGLLGGVTALLGLRLPEEADAHILPLARCRRLHEPSLRRFCLQRAREHNRRHRTCRTIPLTEACRGEQCGFVTDACGRRRDCRNLTRAQVCQGKRCGVVERCGRLHDCGRCPNSEHICLANDTCAYSCYRGCPPGCVCPPEPDPNVISLDKSCVRGDDPNWRCVATPPWYCTTTTDCPIGYTCDLAPCGPGGTFELRCLATCTGDGERCRKYGESCADGTPCCADVPCVGGTCRFN